VAVAKKSLSLLTYDSIEEDESTMTSPKITRKSVVPSSRKYSGASAENSFCTATIAAAGRCGS